MAEALVDTGFYSEVTVTRLIGSHYNRSTASWKIFACFQFVSASGQQGTNCMDSFEALQLDSGDWVVTATVDGVYRWRAINSLGIEPARIASTPPQPVPTTVVPASVTPDPETLRSTQPQSGTSNLTATESDSRSSDQAR